MTTEERITALEEAQGHIHSAIELLTDAVGDNGMAMTYIVDKLEIMVGEGHGFLTDDLNIDNLIEAQKEEK